MLRPGFTKSIQCLLRKFAKTKFYLFLFIYFYFLIKQIKQSFWFVQKADNIIETIV